MPATSRLIRKMTQCAKQRTSKNYTQAIKDVTKIFTVQLLEQGHLEEVYLITTVFWKQKTLNFFFFCKRTNNIHEFDGCLVRLLKNLLTVTVNIAFLVFKMATSTHALLPTFPEESWELKWIRVGFGYVWTSKFFNPDTCGQGLKCFSKFHFVVVQNNSKEMYKKVRCTCKVVFC